MTENRWQRLGGVCGVLYVAVFVATFFTPTTPPACTPVERAGRPPKGASAPPAADVPLSYG